MKYVMVVALLLLVGCSKPQPASENNPSPAQTNKAQRDPEPEPEKEPEEKPTPGQLEPEDSPDQVRARELVETITGLKFKKPVPVYTFTPEELEAEVRGWGDEGFTPDNILGFYKPSTKSLYMVPDAAGEKRQFGLRIHETVHALQDQHYDLAKLHGKPNNGDADMALTALIEGEANQVMIDALIEEQPHVQFITKYGVCDMLKLPANPDKPLTRARLMKIFAYSDGARFVQALKDVDGYATVDSAFKEVPETSEQILHPAKFIGTREPADSITPDINALKAALPEGWTLGEQDTLGELGILIELALNGQREKATAAAEGWGGDVQLTVSKGDHQIQLWVTTWDSKEDAEQFWNAVQDLPDVQQCFWDEPGKARTVIVARSATQQPEQLLGDLTTVLGKSVVVYHDQE